tara:strand:- start:2214 stop:2531 length:318 start_codon:yes stop_codon:yes gene_type:complete
MSSSKQANKARTDNLARAAEQIFQVKHYLDLWSTYPTADNWRRVIDAADAYAPVGNVAGAYFTFTRAAGRAGRVAALGRVSRIGARGCVYEQVFRKGARTWTVAR